ncbi:MAG: energy-coupling factor transporter transmembrane component T family protein [Infirmifilum sp.]
MTGKSTELLRKINPVVKLFAVTVAVFTVALFQNIITTIVNLAVSLLLVFLSRPKLHKFILTGVASTLIGYTWVTYVLFTLNIGLEPSLALYKTLLLSARILIIILYSMFFVATTGPQELASALTLQLKVPYIYSYMTFVTLRMFPLVRRDLENMVAFRKMKGYLKLSRPWQLIISVAAPLLYLVVRRSVMLGIAMESRGFGRYPSRTFIEETTITILDVLFLLAVILLLILSISASFIFKVPLELSL